LTRRAPELTLLPYTTLFRSPFTAGAERELELILLPGIEERICQAFHAKYLSARLLRHIREHMEWHMGCDVSLAGIGEHISIGSEIGRAHVELQSRENLVCRL